MSTNEERDSVGQGTAAGPPPRLPVRASIYIDVDGTVHFGALFEELVPVAESLRGRSSLREPSGEDADEAHAPDAVDDAPGSSRRGGGP